MARALFIIPGAIINSVLWGHPSVRDSGALSCFGHAQVDTESRSLAQEAFLARVFLTRVHISFNSRIHVLRKLPPSLAPPNVRDSGIFPSLHTHGFTLSRARLASLGEAFLALVFLAQASHR